MKWRDEVPLTEADYREIRGRVMERVRTPHAARRLPGLRFAFAAIAAAALIGLFFVPRRSTQRIEPPRIGPVIATQLPATGDRQPATESPASGKQQAASLVTHRHHAHRKHVPEIQTASVIRLDIQTADPDVRIIWFAR